MKVFPVIDIFAGPGGLSEGFSCYSDDKVSFKVQLSVEKDPIAYQTLFLRAFFRQFVKGKVPDKYYQYIRGEISKSNLFEAFPNETFEAGCEVWNAELGNESKANVHHRVEQAIGKAKNWLLIGGPPCQAYSMVGRSRMLGKLRGNLPKKIRDNIQQEILSTNDKMSDGDFKLAVLEGETKRAEIQFRKDHRHKLYREYLEIVGIHQPTVFVMENVKGILSSKMKSGKTLSYILEDLSDPWAALNGSEGLILKKPEKIHCYKIYSFVVEKDDPSQLNGQDFIINSENYGIPQRRHRLLLLGVRDDIDVIPAVLKKAMKQVTVKDVIGTLPRLRSHISRKPDSVGEWEDIIRKGSRESLIPSVKDKKTIEAIHYALKNLAVDCEVGDRFIPGKNSVRGGLGRWLNDRNIKGVIQHRARGHMPSDLLRYLFSSARAEVTGFSPTLYDFPTNLLPSHKNTSNLHKGNGRENRSVIFEDRFRVQVADKPSTTITSHISKDGHYYIHYDPSQCRSLTGREAARLQTFPDNYYFEGNRTQQYEQIGNAVPPYLAFQLAGVVAKVMDLAGLMDVHSSAQRSYNMSRIRSRDTKPEMMLRRALWAEGLRYRVESKLPGKPDIVFRKQKIAIFVDGCFWHGCQQHFQLPNTRSQFWKEKIEANINRDRAVEVLLSDRGWTVYRFWEHQLKSDISTVVDTLVNAVNDI